MKLNEYLDLMPEGDELTVWDKDYDMETYFYGGKPHDKCDKSIYDLSKLLTIEEIKRNGVVVNLSEIIEKNVANLKKSELLIRYDIDLIMDDMESILSGNVSETWMEQFVGALR